MSDNSNMFPPDGGLFLKEEVPDDVVEHIVSRCERNIRMPHRMTEFKLDGDPAPCAADLDIIEYPVERKAHLHVTAADDPSRKACITIGHEIWPLGLDGELIFVVSEQGLLPAYSIIRPDGTSVWRNRSRLNMLQDRDDYARLGHWLLTGEDTNKVD